MSEGKTYSMFERLANTIQKGIEDSIDAEILTAIGSTGGMRDNLTFAAIEEAMESVRHLGQRVKWREDREACRKDDLEKRRGTLILNPELEGAENMSGTVTEKYGIEYRVIADDALRGARGDGGEIRGGYWVDPTPPVVLPPIAMPDFEHRPLTRQFYYGATAPHRSVTGVGIEPVDCSPPPILWVNSTKSLKRIWRTDRHMFPGGSLKQYARKCKAGLEWLARKRK